MAAGQPGVVGKMPARLQAIGVQDEQPSGGLGKIERLRAPGPCPHDAGVRGEPTRALRGQQVAGDVADARVAQAAPGGVEPG